MNGWVERRFDTYLLIWLHDPLAWMLTDVTMVGELWPLQFKESWFKVTCTSHGKIGSLLQLFKISVLALDFLFWTCQFSVQFFFYVSDYFAIPDYQSWLLYLFQWFPLQWSCSKWNLRADLRFSFSLWTLNFNGTLNLICSIIVWNEPNKIFLSCLHNLTVFWV